MMEIYKSTQETAANSEESALASDEISAQVNELLSLVMQLESLVGATSKGMSINYETTYSSAFHSSKKHISLGK